MPTSTLTSKGQLTLPKPIRDQMGLDAGSKLDFIVQADGTIKRLVKKWLLNPIPPVLK